MIIVNAICIIAIIVATVIWYKAKFFISDNVEKYNMFIHITDYKYLKTLSNNSDPAISTKAREHHKNIVISTIVIIISMVLIMAGIAN